MVNNDFHYATRSYGNANVQRRSDALKRPMWAKRQHSVGDARRGLWRRRESFFSLTTCYAMLCRSREYSWNRGKSGDRAHEYNHAPIQCVWSSHRLSAKHPASTPSPSISSRPHQQQSRSNIVECYKSNDFFDKVECCFDIVAVFWWQQCRTSSSWNLVLSTESKQIEHVQCVWTLSERRNFVRHCCQKSGNNIEAKFDFVERIEILAKFGRLVFEICKPTDRQTNIQARWWWHYLAPLPGMAPAAAYIPHSTVLRVKA